MPISSPEDVLNESLRAIGFGKMIGDIYEGTPQSRAGLEIYSQTRDAVMRDGEWSFTRGSGALPLLKGPPPAGGYNPLQPFSAIYPIAPWLYEYGYPSDCIEVRDLIPQPTGLPVLDPKPIRFRIDNDLTPIVNNGVAAGPAERVVLCNVPSVIAVYVRRVTNPLLWPPDFTETLIDVIGKKLAASPILAASQDAQKIAMADASGIAEMAQRHQG